MVASLSARRFVISLLPMLAAALWLGGCGQRGALYFAEQAAEPAGKTAATVEPGPAATDAPHSDSQATSDRDEP